jgi:type I restriction enzyme M protein
MLTNFNLHTVVRLPNGVFAPYTSIPTNILFFDRTGPTTDIWYYEVSPPEGRKQYTKTASMPFEAFADCLAWFADRKENERAWKVPFAKEHEEARAKAEPRWQAATDAEARAKTLKDEIAALDEQIGALEESRKDKDTKTQLAALKADRGTKADAANRERELARTERNAGDEIYWPVFNLDRKNPNAKAAAEHLPPEELVKSILEKEARIAAIVGEIKSLLAEGVK